RVGFAILGNTSPNELTAISKAGALLWPLLLGETLAEGDSAAKKSSPAEPAAKPLKNPPAPAATATKLPTVDQVLARAIAAHGGERNMRRHKSMEMHTNKTYENHGVHADVVVRASEPANRSEREEWFAAGRPIGWVRSFVDGSRGGQETSFGQDAN